ncbi:NAD(P)-dependent dehydrogenase, short-chain alcohol dehydrogenase family [Devosia lucknowensis]|uniref:NAD(P)-dependent dehydrogenase, short-chain alcohol dehydrogenase family n=1 Tax=Devosia lucknowensis TaxID=1096929 RepID=A0A1Y6EQU0_9HYPH|nr:SDR family oxidoreductase [Devosia lucknowensis]SMQ65065.1 NAD(P)-dependent dehydrogenase, short-chain alcohol dehydrogenase family [Devosia lucknowensis]
MLLKDKVAVVYGGSGAVGSAVARAFAREGAIVHLAARRIDPLESVARDIRERGGHAFAGRVDALNPDSVAAHLDQVVSHSGPIKIAFSAVDWGDSQGRDLIDHDFETFMRPVQNGLKSWFNVGTAYARHMGENGGGVILGFTANAARQAFGQMGGFGVASAAVEHFLRHLAVESGPKGVRCCWVRSPGSPDTPGIREVWTIHAKERGMSFDELHAEFAKDTPLRHIASLSQTADAAVLLASDLASSMTATLANTTGGGQVD